MRTAGHDGASGAARQRVARGDFQTPIELATRIAAHLRRLGVAPAAAFEPTCGRGAFVAAALVAFPGLRVVRGIEIDGEHLATARTAANAASNERASRGGAACRVELEQGDFFARDRSEEIATLPEPLLVIGNPPWVTTATLARVDATNGPRRTNVDRLRGIEALTGRGHFDVSEAVVREALRWIGKSRGVVALLCKAAVARKALHAAWREGAKFGAAALWRIDAREAFGASVDAALLVVRSDVEGATQSCDEYESLDATTPARTSGMVGELLIADLAAWSRATPKQATQPMLSMKDVKPAGWRSGIKHDAAAIFELKRCSDGLYENRLGERVALEPSLVYPLLKATDLHHGRVPTRWLLVPQRAATDDPARLLADAPLARAYLERHAVRLAARKSSVYRKRPPYSLFGLGPYTFAPWKVAVSAFHASANFRVIGPIEDQLVVFDDTCCLLAFADEAAARASAAELARAPFRDSLTARCFVEAKRPITVALLDSLPSQKGAE
jgi:hypothetical protein